MRLPLPLRRLAWRGYLSAAARLHELKTLSWVATNRCNLSCPHCAQCASPQADTRAELSTAEVKTFFTELAEDFDVKSVAVAVTGGEPLTRPDLFELAGHIHGLGFEWGLSTNGLLLDKRALALCQRTGLGAASISLDGLEAAHDGLRGPGAFAGALAAIERLRSAGFVRALEVATCLTPAVAASLDELYRFLSGLGLTQWRLQPVAAVGRAQDQPELRLGAAQLRTSLEWLAKQRRAPAAPLKVVIDESGYFGWQWEERLRDTPFMCGAGINGAAVLADGTVTGCVFLGRGFAQGNVRERRLSAIWREEFQVLRDRRWTRRGYCAKCPSHPDCRGGCLLNWESSDAAGPCGCWARALSPVGGTSVPRQLRH